VLEGLISLLYPPRCVGCQRLLDEHGRAFCPACQEAFRAVASPLCVWCGLPFAGGSDHPCGRCLTARPLFGRARAVAHYAASEEGTSPPTQALYRFKYRGDLGVGKTLAGLVAEHFPYAGQDYDVVVPVPLHVSRLRKRGFNQAAVLSKGVARRHGLALDVLSLQRTRAGAQQVGLSEEERRRNVRGAFGVVRPRQVAGKSIVLIDDVYTTGATANECARKLLAAGAHRVDVFTLLRAAPG